MLNFFQALRGAAPAPAGAHDPALVEAAMHRALEATDPRVRSLPGHRRRLRPAVEKAIDHVATLAQALPAPVEASGRTYAEDARLAAFFATAERLSRLLGTDRALLDFLDGPAAPVTAAVHALLVMQRTEKRFLGCALRGGLVQREVSQVRVSFDGHRLLAPAATAADHARHLRGHAFDRLLALARRRIGLAGEGLQALEARRSMLAARLRAARRPGGGPVAQAGGEEHGASAIEAKLAQVDGELAAAGAGPGRLPRHLDLLVDTLDHAADQLRLESVDLRMDRMGIRQEGPGEAALDLRLLQASDATGRSVVVLPIVIPREAIRVRDAMADLCREPA